MEQRKEQCTLEYTKNHTQRKLTKEQLLSFQHMIKEESRIYYPELETCILSFSLQSQEQYLNRLNSCFVRVDQDQDGILNESEFKELFCILQKEYDIVAEPDLESETQKLLEVIDPHNN